MLQSSFWDLVLGNRSTAPLGHLESEVLALLPTTGGFSVRDVQSRMERKLAYTTVMTTLDRLYKKGLLVRTKSDRRFCYTLASLDWKQAPIEPDGLITELLRSRADAQLISCLIDGLAAKDVVLLEQLEQMAAARRKELNSKETD